MTRLDVVDAPPAPTRLALVDPPPAPTRLATVAGTHADAVYDAADPASATSHITRTSAALYKAYQAVGRGRYVEVWFEQDSGLPGGYTPAVHLLHWTNLVAPVLVTGDDDASVAYTGTGWTVVSGNHRTTTTDDAATWTTPAATVVGIRRTLATSNGYGLVELDGSRTAATLCPTAQQEVDAGRLPSTALVANGGTLNPTDRVLEFYTDAAGSDHLIADGLAAAVHTVKVTNTGYKRAAATDDRIQIDGFLHATATTTPATASVTLVLDKRLMNSESAYEFAYRMTIGGVQEWTGNIHGYEKETGWTVTIDGTPTTMTDGQTLTAAATLVLTRTSELYHPNHAAGATKTADCTVTYTVDGDGLTVDHSTTWLTAATPVACYPAMMPVQQAAFDRRYLAWDRGSGSAITTDVALSADTDVDTTTGQSDTMWMWTAAGRIFTVARVADPTTALQNWAYSGTGAFLQDRSLSGGTGMNKAYWPLQHASGAAMPAVGNGTVWPGSTTYRWAVVADADAVCSQA